jgi:hypothetical protein
MLFYSAKIKADSLQIPKVLVTTDCTKLLGSRFNTVFPDFKIILINIYVSIFFVLFYVPKNRGVNKNGEEETDIYLHTNCFIKPRD